ncbi:response regulator transcription factor [Muricauda sp. MAR_2010_75]|uniref:response regulator n=1 Tax=Allomuricauda sp. MAR_2010_75 TaxID=1250232 RepID=UPI000567C504|nr:response regulator transcription factor [Muricauda sp. MAR_2010_75]
MGVDVLMYEDNDNLRESLVGLLSREKGFSVVGDFPLCDGIEADMEKLRPDVVLMDIDLPGLNGIEAVKKIRTFNLNVKILMITVFDDSPRVYQALHAGANGYLLKKHISERLVTAIQDVMEGGAPMSPAIARLIIGDITKKGIQKTAGDYNLSPREIDVLVSLSKGNSYKMVADHLCISLETVRSHIKKVYDKLHVRSQGEAIGKALREGLID